MLNLVRSGLWRSVALILGAVLLSGCETRPREFETPIGPVEGDLFEQLQILGVSYKITATLNQRRGRTVVETIDIEVPVGTQVIIPVLRSWRLAYGEIDPDTFEAHTFEPGEWNYKDHNYGFGQVNISVLDINAPDFSVTPARQTATIFVSLLLADYNADDRWFGAVAYSLIYLGRPVAPVAVLSFDR